MKDDIVKLILLIVIVILIACNLSVTVIFNYVTYKQNEKILDFVFISSIAKTTSEESILAEMLRDNKKLKK